MGQKPFDPEDKFADWWAGEKGRKTINKMREVLGMPPIEDKRSPCRKCTKNFWTTFKLGRAQQFYCPKCRENMSKQDTGFSDCPVGR